MFNCTVAFAIRETRDPAVRAQDEPKNGLTQLQYEQLSSTEPSIDKGIGWPCGAYVVMRSPVISAIFLSNRCSRVDVSGVVNRKDVNSVWERRMLRKFGW
jgi:hypothetical protein